MQGRAIIEAGTLHVNVKSKHKHKLESVSGARANSSVVSHLPSIHSTLGLIPGRKEDRMQEAGRKEMPKT